MLANGVDLTTLAYNIRSRTGRLNTAPRRGKNIEVPGRHGSIFMPGKKFDSLTVILPMWVIGADVNGLVPTDGTLRSVFIANLDKLTRIFSADTVELLDTMPNGSVRRIVGQVIDAITPDVQAQGTRAAFSVSLATAASFWEDVSAVTASKTGTSGTWEVTQFAGATAPMDDLKVKFTGPCTNPRVTNPSGVYVAYNGALTSDQTVTIDCATWSFPAADQVGITPSYSALDHDGDPRWFVLAPRDPNPQAFVTQTAGTTGVFQLVGKRKYMIG